MIIEVSDASYSYNRGEVIFEDIGFSVSQGEILSILGPNGCGKTTLLKCINALFSLDAGSVRINGKELHDFHQSDIGKTVGYVPQVSESTFPYTVLEMVLMGRAAHLALFSSPSQHDVDIAQSCLEDLGIAYLAERPYSNISGGQAQLVLIARAMAAEPQVLLLDEPTSHLDFRNQMVILNTLEKLSADKNIASIMTTHFPDHALSVSDKAMLMGDNKTGLSGDVSEVLSEENLQRVFGIDIRIIDFEDENNKIKTIVPLRKGALMAAPHEPKNV